MPRHALPRHATPANVCRQHKNGNASLGPLATHHAPTGKSLSEKCTKYRRTAAFKKKKVPPHFVPHSAPQHVPPALLSVGKNDAPLCRSDFGLFLAATTTTTTTTTSTTTSTSITTTTSTTTTTTHHVLPHFVAHSTLVRREQVVQAQRVMAGRREAGRRGGLGRWVGGWVGGEAPTGQ